MIPEYIELETTKNPDSTIIWLHGLGADGHDFEAIVPELGLPGDMAIRFIFPHAPFRPITLNNGYVMRGWYDIKSLTFGSDEDIDGIKDSADALGQLVEREIARGIPAHRIILAGFSQGGAIVLYTGLTTSKPLAGLMVLSSYLPLAQHLPTDMTSNLNIFMGHGRQDDIVRFEYGQGSRQQLENRGLTVEWHDYEMAHSVCAEEIDHIREWIIKRLK
ncbi:MAG: alpha/beta hydrolase [Gammaproteobacteria bacterium]|nr:alpha/beta hydrolase [Gammaproteobacteria bacterium]